MARASTEGVLTRLRKDEAGNTLAMMCAMLIPLLGFSGAAIDMARLYVVKVRLQQACDAGALAGRKAMKDTTPGTLDSGAAQQAQTFFANNFRSGWFRNTTPTFTPTKSTVGTSSAVANAVTGNANVTVPMSLMTIFGVKPQRIAVTCQAVYDLADTDVMFVLDTTGSMSVPPSSGGEGGTATYTRDDGIDAIYRQESTGSKIEALRQAVILFDKTMTENKQTDTIVRYGFAPYSTVVNVGKLLSVSSISSNLDYNSRQIDGDYDTQNVTKVTGIAQSACVQNARYPSSGYANGFSYTYKTGNGNSTASKTVASTGAAYVTFTGAVSWNNNVCTSTNATAVVYRPWWKYGKVTFPASVVQDYAALKTVSTPGRADGSTSKWRGCIELTDTSTASSFSADSLPSDLDPDVMPNWRPMWPEAVWQPQSTSDIKDETPPSESKSYKGLGTYESNDSVTCPMEAQTLLQMSSSQVHDYVYATNFKSAGNTYHDYGMAWGLRMLSTKGPFKDSVAPPSGRKQAGQNIVFMTDGTPVADNDNYQMYGIEGLDGRMAGGVSATEKNNHVSRLRVLCDAAKARGITIYMIAFGTSVTADMKYCATSGQWYYAKDSDTLQDAFASIAKRIAMLRVSQ